MCVRATKRCLLLKSSAILTIAIKLCGSGVGAEAAAPASGDHGLGLWIMEFFVFAWATAWSALIKISKEMILQSLTSSWRRIWICLTERSTRCVGIFAWDRERLLFTLMVCCLERQRGLIKWSTSSGEITGVVYLTEMTLHLHMRFHSKRRWCTLAIQMICANVLEKEMKSSARNLERGIAHPTKIAKVVKS